ncbi:MAG: GDP-mannose 4,6-dehydratase, partial [Devosiaceae bacterium]|nr:GDP-mannose 4,6-dehydratase [Devosiaceae bacterium]
MKIFLTGGCGFIGSAAARLLINSGHSVLNVDKLTYAGNLQTIAEIDDHQNYQFISADIVDNDDMQ